MEILRHGKNVQVYFICEVCGCEFKELKGSCYCSYLKFSDNPVFVTPCPECGSDAVGMAAEEYTQALKNRTQCSEDTLLPENEN